MKFNKDRINSVAPSVGLGMLGPPLGAWLHALPSTPELVYETTFFPAMALKLI